MITDAGKLAGVIVTSTVGTRTDERTLRALTIGHIDRTLFNRSGHHLADILDETNPTAFAKLSYEFNTYVAPQLTAALIKSIEKDRLIPTAQLRRNPSELSRWNIPRRPPLFFNREEGVKIVFFAEGVVSLKTTTNALMHNIHLPIFLERADRFHQSLTDFEPIPGFLSTCLLHKHFGQ